MKRSHIGICFMFSQLLLSFIPLNTIHSDCTIHIDRSVAANHTKILQCVTVPCIR